MFFFNKIPLFRLALPLTAGIITGIYTGDYFLNSAFVFAFSVFIFLFSLFILLLLNKTSYRNRWIFGLSLHIFLVLTGIFISIINTQRFYPSHISNFDQQPHWYCIKALDDIKEKPKSFRLEAEVLSMFEKGKSRNANGRVILYLQKDSISSIIKYGDVMLVRASLQQLRETQNPAQFNYKQFLLFHQVTRQAYIASQYLKLTGINKGYPVMKKIYELRNFLLNVLRQHGLHGREFAVGAALILGYTDELDPEIMRSYAGSGAMHVLSVSGLHVGIMYVVVSFFLSLLLNRFRTGNIIKAILLLAFLAFYAMITGLSPSVLRAAVMFGFIVIAKSFKYHTNIYNTLAVSAISLLVWDPYLVMQVGFQLSYLAVIGIVSIQPLLVQQWEPKTKLMKWVWEITCVSVAAQVATAPLGFLYFHQFPVYFMISNLIVIPLSTIILYFGLATLLFTFIPPVCEFLTHLLDYLIWFLNKSVEITESMPYSILGGIDISISETWLFYAVVLSMFIFFTRKNIAGLYVSLAALLIISVTQFIETVQQSSQNQLVVYNVAGTSVYDIIHGRQNSFFAPAAFARDKDKMLFNVEHNWWKCGLEKQNIVEFDSLTSVNGIQFFPVGNKRALKINARFNPEANYTRKLKTDFIILSENAPVEISELIRYFNPEIIIFDSSNSFSQCSKWESQCKKASVSFFNVLASGAFIANL